MQNVRKVGEVEVQGEVNRWLLAQTGGARDKGLGRAGGLQRQQARMSDDARLDSTRLARTQMLECDGQRGWNNNATKSEAAW